MSENPLDLGLFHPDAVLEEIRALNDEIIKLFSDQPNWWDVGAAEARAARRHGDGPFPPLVFSKRAQTRLIPSPSGHQIPLRIISPEQPCGVYLHFHGGGWVLGGADMQDPMLERFADATNLIVVSVEYRLAPEHPYPAGPDDCEAAAWWLVQNAKSEFGCDELTIGGESAGAHLSAVTLVRLRERHGYTGFCGANLVYGAFDMSMTPSQRLFGETRLVLRTSDIIQFTSAFLPPTFDRRDPDISPLYADLKGLCPALFSVGTVDALLDDTLFMYARWLAAGNVAKLTIYPGGFHGFTLLPNALTEQAEARMTSFLKGVTRR